MNCHYVHETIGGCAHSAVYGGKHCRLHTTVRWNQGFLQGETSRCCMVASCTTELSVAADATSLSSSLCEEHQEQSGLGTARFAHFLITYLSIQPGIEQYIKEQLEQLSTEA